MAYPLQYSWASLAGEEYASNEGDLGLITGLGRSPGEGNSYSLQYSGLENSMDSIIHGIPNSWTRLSNIHFHFHDLNDRRDRKERRLLLFIRTEYYITGATSDLE